MKNYIISTGQPIGEGAYQPKEVYVSYEPTGAITGLGGGVTFDGVKNEFVVPVNVYTFNFTDDGVAMMGSLVNGEWVFIDHFDVSYEPTGAITGLGGGVTFDGVKNEFVVPVNVYTFTFNDDGVAMIGSFVNGEWVFIDHFDVSYEPNGAITDLTVGVTSKIVFDIPDGVDFFTFKDNGVAIMGSLVNGEWVFIDHFDVSYVPNGAITDIVPTSVTFDSVKNEFVVPVDVSTFTFSDNGVPMRGDFVNGEWVFIDHFDVSYEPNGAITGIMPLTVTFDGAKNEFSVPLSITTFNFSDDGVAMMGSLVNGEWVFIDHFDVSYVPNGAITDIVPTSVTFDSVKNEFVVPVNIPSFTFKDNGVGMRGDFVNGEWVIAIQ